MTATRVKKRTQEVLAAQAAGNYAGLFKSPAAVEPDAAIYGVMAPARARTLEASSVSSDPVQHYVEGPFDDIALAHAAKDEQAAYERQLAASRDAQERMTKEANRYGIIGKALDKQPDSKFVTDVHVDDNGNVINDPFFASTQNADTQADNEAARRSVNATTANTYHDAGIRLDPELVAQRDRGAWDSATPQGYGLFNKEGLNPVEAETGRHDRASEATDRANAAANMVRANKGDGGGGSETTIIVPLPGGGQKTIKRPSPSDYPNTDNPAVTANDAAASRHGYKITKTSDGGRIYSDGNNRIVSQSDAFGNPL